MLAQEAVIDSLKQSEWQPANLNPFFCLFVPVLPQSPARIWTGRVRVRGAVEKRSRALLGRVPWSFLLDHSLGAKQR